MNSNNAPHTIAILFVDDDADARAQFQRIFGNTFQVFLASDAEEAKSFLKNNGHHVGVVISDQYMPGIDGISFLKELQSEHPEVMRIMSTGNCSMDLSLQAINEAGVFRICLKPWNIANTLKGINDAIKRYLHQKIESCVSSLSPTQQLKDACSQWVLHCHHNQAPKNDVESGFEALLVTYKKANANAATTNNKFELEEFIGDLLRDYASKGGLPSMANAH